MDNTTIGIVLLVGLAMGFLAFRVVRVFMAMLLMVMVGVAAGILFPFSLAFGLVFVLAYGLRNVGKVAPPPAPVHVPRPNVVPFIKPVLH